MPPQKKTDVVKRKKADAVNIIGAVTGPLRLFALIVLVIEVAFGVIAAMSEGADRTYLILGMIVIMVLIILAVIVMAIWRPYSLYGPAKPEPVKLASLRPLVNNCFTLFKQTLIACTQHDLKLRLNLLRYDVKSNKLVMYMQDDEYQDKYFETEVKSGLKKGIVICEALKKGGLVSRNLPPDHYTHYSDSPIPEVLASVMAFPIKNTNGKNIAVVALDSSLRLEDLGIQQDKLEGLFLKLCNVLEDMIQTAGMEEL